MHITGIHRASSNTVYFYALCIQDFTHIGIGLARYRRDSTNRWRWDYTVTTLLNNKQGDRTCRF